MESHFMSTLLLLLQGTSFAYPEISVTDESGCLPVYLLQDQDACRRPSITRGIGKPPPTTEADQEIPLASL